MQRAIPAVVKIVGWRDGGPAFSGSGTIITRDGLIVTNAHVGKPDADGLAVQYQAPFVDDPVDKLEVLLTASPDKPPEARYLAEVVAADGYLDAAVLRITANVDAKRVAPGSLNLPFVAVGDSDQLDHFDPLHVVGFPGIGGDTVSAAPGEVSGFVSDSKVPEARGWIKTSALIYHGNSGGLAANAAGQLIGIPTRLPDFAVTVLPGGYNLIRPINLVKPLIATAIAGQTSFTSRYLTPGTGTEKLTQVGWTTADDKGCGRNPPITSYPTGAKSIRGVFSWTGMTKGQDVLLALVGAHAGKDKQPALIDLIARTWDGTSNSSNACRLYGFSNSAGWPDDTYTLVATVGSQRRGTSTMKVVVGGTPPVVDGIFLKGQILSSATGAGLPGATVYVLKEGVDARSWIDAKTDSDVAASAVTAANGAYLMTRPVTKGDKKYPLVVLAAGYRSWLGTLGPINGPNVGDISLSPQ
jgi:S1-C subfamily serine protease